ncbi:ABC [Ectocarpus sp. CCAP 1310/34]|nr:ABC [Ectocarpus sp. CCAP 1310/34]
MPPRWRRTADVSLFEAIRSYTDVSASSFLVCVACLIGVADVGCAVALYGVVHSWAPRSWGPLVMLQHMWGDQNFSKDTADILLLVFARLSVLPLIAFLAATKGKPPNAAPASTASGADNASDGNSSRAGRGRTNQVAGKKKPFWRRVCSCFVYGESATSEGRGGTSGRRQAPSSDLNSLEGGESLHLPLLSSTHGGGAGRSDEVNSIGYENGGGLSINGGASEEKSVAIGEGDTLTKTEIETDGARRERDKEDAERAAAGAEAAEALAERKKSAFLVVMFALSTAMQVYTGVKCVRFRFTKEVPEGLLMGIGVLWLNAMVWALNQLVADATMEEGLLEPSLHPHRLFPGSMAGHRCDICQQRIKSQDAKAWRCKLCDFDLCRSCYEKKDRRGAEGALRGDKGLRDEENLSTLTYFKRALRLAGPHWPFFMVAFACLAISNTARIALPNFQGGILDKVVNGDDEGFKRYIVLYIILSAITGTIGSVQRLCFRLAGVRIAIGARNKLFRGVISQDVAFFEGTTTGKLTSRLTSDVNAMVSPCTYMLGTLFSNILLLAGGMVMCFVTSWRLSMLAFTTVGPIYHITQRYAKWSQQLNVEIYVAYGEANGHATEALSNVRTVKAMSTELQEMAKYDTATQVALDKGVKDSFGSAGTNAMSSYLDLGAGALILWYGGSLAMEDDRRMTAGRLITYQLYWNMINNSWQALLGVISSLTRAAGAAQRVFSLMDSLPDIDIDSGLPLDDLRFRGEIAIKGVEFTYQMRPDNKVLKGVDLHIPAGSTCALVGRSGSGKTTLVHLLLRFYDPRAGQILVDGVPLTDLNLRELHRKTAIVAQDTQLFATSIYDNITYGLEEGEFTKEEVYAAAKQACAHDFISDFADGYHTRVGERGTRLSGGQKQRVAIARALLRKPRILLLDEATSALDAESEASVQQALDKLVERGAGSTTVVLVAHRLSTVMNADNIAVLDKGRLVEQGTHDSLVRAGGVYSSLVARQISRAANTLQQEAEGVQPSGGPVDIDTLMDELEGKETGKAGGGGGGGNGQGNGGDTNADVGGETRKRRGGGRGGRGR